jgi:hypothetical protein
LAIETEMSDARLQMYHGLKALHEAAHQIKKVANDYRLALESLNHVDLLQTALDDGEISIWEYLMEVGIYYEAVNQSLAAEWMCRFKLAKMYAFQLE